MKKIKRGEIRICNLGQTEGSVQGGFRPVLVIQNDVGNKYSPVVIVCPITSKTNIKAKLPTHMILPKSIGLKKTSLLLTEQIITVNKSCIGRKITKLSPVMMNVVEKRIQISLSLSKHKHKNIYFRKRNHKIHQTL